MQKYITKHDLKDHILTPGDEGFSDPIIPGNWERNLAGWKKADGAGIEIHGYFLIDRRVSNVAIFTNMKFESTANVRPVFKEDPIPFQSLDEAVAFKKSMNLSMSDDDKISVAALCPDPGMGVPRPDTLFVPKEEVKRM
jgi:hypothetical protein